MKKEALQTTTVKTLLAVLLFAGIGTIIIGGGYIIGEYSKNKIDNKIVEPINQETENCAKEGETIHLTPSSNSKAKNFCCEGLNEREPYVITNDNKCDIPLIYSAICINCPNGKCGTGENKCNCPEDCGETTDTSNWQTYRNEEFGFEVKYPEEFSPQKIFQIEPDGMIFSSGNTIYNFSVSRYSEKYVSEKKAIYTEEYCSEYAGYNDCIFWQFWLNEWNGNSKVFISKSNGDNCKKEYDHYQSRCLSCEVVLFDNKKAIKKVISLQPNGDYFHWRLIIEKEGSRFHLDLASDFWLLKEDAIVSEDFSLQQIKDKQPKELFNQILSTFKFTD